MEFPSIHFFSLLDPSFVYKNFYANLKLESFYKNNNNKMKYDIFLL